MRALREDQYLNPHAVPYPKLPLQSNQRLEQERKMHLGMNSHHPNVGCQLPVLFVSCDKTSIGRRLLCKSGRFADVSSTKEYFDIVSKFHKDRSHFWLLTCTQHGTRVHKVNSSPYSGHPHTPQDKQRIPPVYQCTCAAIQ